MVGCALVNYRTGNETVFLERLDGHKCDSTGSGKRFVLIWLECLKPLYIDRLRSQGQSEGGLVCFGQVQVSEHLEQNNAVGYTTFRG